MTIKKETGEQRQFSTGAKKQAATNKGTPVLFPGDAYLDVCKHFEEGGKLHGDRNWEKGLPLSEIINSLERHIAQEKMGLTDEPHARAIAWNAIVYLATKLRIQNGILPKELADIQTIYNNDKKFNYICDDCEHKFDETVFGQKKSGTDLLLNGCPECGCSSFTALDECTKTTFPDNSLHAQGTGE